MRLRREEIEGAVRAAAYAIADPGEVTDPAYAQGLRAAISSAVDYGLGALEADRSYFPAVPVVLIAQARLAARNRIGIDTVLRRYVAGYALFNDFLVQEAERADLSATTLRCVARSQGDAIDRLLAVASEEYAREGRPSLASAEHQRLQLVRRLLAGEQADSTGLQYNFKGFHLGLIAAGPRATEITRKIAAAAYAPLLTVRPDPNTIWAWLGGRQPLDPLELSWTTTERQRDQTALAIGEPAQGLEGWRLTHRQALAALPIAQHEEDRVARYIDVALLAAVLHNDLTAAALRHFYLEPLKREPDGGKGARETLRAYFAADRNVSSTAVLLGVSRNTVGSRLRAVEAAIGRQHTECGAELEVALEMERLMSD